MACMTVSVKTFSQIKCVTAAFKGEDLDALILINALC